MKHLLFFLLAFPLVGWGQTKPEKADHMPIFFESADWRTYRPAATLKQGSDTLIIDPEIIHFLSIGSRTYRIVRPEAYIEEVGGNPWTGFGIDEGPAGWEATDAARIAAYLDSVKLPWSVEPPLPPPYTGTRDSSGMWIWGRNRGTIFGQPEILWYPPTSALLRKISDSFVLSTDQSDTNHIFTFPKKHPKKKP